MSFLDGNRASWDEWAGIHIEDLTGSYRIERFLAGEDVLCPIEAAEIGDVAGLRVLHLHCHIGLDTLCLARRGADVTGLDFSRSSLGHAHDLAEKAGLSARFVLGGVYDAPALCGTDFDLVYTTWGTNNWLPDIRGWGKVVATVLKPGGSLYFADDHPSFALMDEADGRPVPILNWRTPSSPPLESAPSETYTGDPRPLVNRRNFEWIHPLSDILMALIDHGLAIERITEREALPWRMLPVMEKGSDRLYRLPPGLPRMPFAVSLRARKPR